MKTCRYFDCDESIRSNYVVCRDHYDDYKAEKFDDCPSCGHLKLKRYKSCLNCKDGSSRKGSLGVLGSAVAAVREIIDDVTSEPKRSSARIKSKSRKPAASSVPDPWKDSETENFYVYIMELDGGIDYYVGQTNDVRARKLEHRQGRTKSTAGHEPKLKWFTRVRTREEAVQYEQHLTGISKASGGRAIARMIIEFGDLVRSIDGLEG